MSRGKVRTINQDGTRPRYLGEIGPVTALKYGFTVPGGCDQMTCLLGIDPMKRTDAMNPGRIVQVIYGASVIWEGTLDEPQPAREGWTVMAHGSGTWGSEYVARYDDGSALGPAAWNGATSMQAALANAIGRANGPLRWIWSDNLATISPAVHSTDEFTSGSRSITDMLNSAVSISTSDTAPGETLTWYVRRGVEGNRLKVVTLPTEPTRNLVVTTPAPRTIGGDINYIYIWFCIAKDAEGTPARFTWSEVFDWPSIAAHGRKEAFIDLSNAGVLTAGQCRNIGYGILSRYMRANYAGPFTARYGQLTTLGGQPQDLAVYWYESEGPMVVKLMLADQGWGGEVTPGEVSFLVGKYEYDDTLDQATITPFNYLATDMGQLISAAASGVKGT